MKVVLAVHEYDAHVIGLLTNTEDEVVFMNHWLHEREPGMFRPTGFKVYNFEPGAQKPMIFGTMLYPVVYEGFSGKVSTHA